MSTAEAPAAPQASPQNGATGASEAFLPAGVAGGDELSSLRQRLSAQGFRMPAEWEPHDRCWMLWPERPDNWRENARPAQLAFAEVATAISQFEPVTMLASAKQWERARSLLPPSVRVLEGSANDAWMRDIGPTFVVGGGSAKKLLAMDWKFNAWGGVEEGCYPDWSLDDVIPSKVCEIIGGAERVSTSFVMEGGSIHVDGEGTLLTTAECLLNPNRNPHLTRSGIEERLAACLGVTTFIWMPRGLEGDQDTNGHIDNLACFARPGVVLLSWTDDPSHPQFEVCAEALEVLQGATDAKGRKIQVVKLPLPPAMRYTTEDLEGLRPVDEDGHLSREAEMLLPATYANFYIANGGIVAPAFGIEESDAAAKQVLQETFPDRKVILVSRGRDIILGGGNVHCITQQQPAVA